MMRVIFAIVFLMFFQNFLYGQLTFTGEFKPRTEYNHGTRTLASPGQKAVFFTEQRTRINLGYQEDKYKVKLAVQDVRTWGSSRQLIKDDSLSKINIFEAWGEIQFSEVFSLRFGRQKLAYDDERILGGNDWAAQARTHDAALLKFEGAIKAHIGIAYNQDKVSQSNRIYTINGSYKAMQFLWLNKSTEKFGASFLFLNNGVQGFDTNQNDKINYSQTIGARLQHKGDKFGLMGEGYFQTGKVGNEDGRDVSAHQLRLEANYKLSDKFSLLAGYERMSGTDSENISNSDVDNKSFTPLYGTNHKFNGLIDYFYVGGGHVNNVGLQDLYIKGKYTAGKHTAKADIHFFASAADIADPDDLTNTLSNNLGTELDFNWSYKYSDNISFFAGYSILFPTTSTEAIKVETNPTGSKDERADWGYIMILVKPNFLSKKDKKANKI